VKDDLVYVEHVLDCIARIETYTGGDKSVFLESTLVQDAVLRNLQIMAESTQHLSEAIRQKHPEVGWRGLAGFRNVLAHGYLGLDAQRIWELVETRFAALRASMERIRAELVAEDGPGDE
jgi:uncharacterized protein with HEPN domain